MYIVTEPRLAMVSLVFKVFCVKHGVGVAGIFCSLPRKTIL